MGFFAEAGPLQVFVSEHLIPEEFKLDATDENSFVSSDEALRIQAGTEVRLRIVGTRFDTQEIVRPRTPSPAPWPFPCARGLRVVCGACFCPHHACTRCTLLRRTLLELCKA